MMGALVMLAGIAAVSWLVYGLSVRAERQAKLERQARRAHRAARVGQTAR